MRRTKISKETKTQWASKKAVHKDKMILTWTTFLLMARQANKNPPKLLTNSNPNSRPLSSMKLISQTTISTMSRELISMFRREIGWSRKMNKMNF